MVKGSQRHNYIDAYPWMPPQAQSPLLYCYWRCPQLIGEETDTRVNVNPNLGDHEHLPVRSSLYPVLPIAMRDVEASEGGSSSIVSRNTTCGLMPPLSSDTVVRSGQSITNPDTTSLTSGGGVQLLSKSWSRRPRSDADRVSRRHGL